MKQNVFKKLLAAGLCVAMVFSIAACGSTSPAAGDSTSPAAGNTDEAASAAVETETEAGELIQIDVVLDWYPNAIHTFLYDAIDKGYFEEEGLSVNLISPAESVDAITFVSTGKAQIGLTYPIEIVQASEKGMPVKALASVSQKALDCMCSLAETGVDADLANLKGSKVGYAGTAVSKAIFTTVANEAGLTEADYELVDVGFDLVTSLTTESVDFVIGTFINDEIVTMENAGYDLDVFIEQDYGVPEFYGLVMAVNTDEYDADPAVYEAFLRACSKGFADIQNDEEAAMEIIMGEMNSDDNPLDEDQQKKSYEILIPRMQPEGSEFLAMEDSVWQEVIDWMLGAELIEKEVSVEDVTIDR